MRTRLLALVLVVAACGDTDTGDAPDAAVTSERVCNTAFTTFKLQPAPEWQCVFDVSTAPNVAFAVGYPWMYSGSGVSGHGPGQYRSEAMKWDEDPGREGVVVMLNDSTKCQWIRCLTLEPTL